MSYSFSVNAASKKEVKVALAAKLDEVIAIQPMHTRNRAAILANAGAVIDLLPDDDTQDVSVSCNGQVVQIDDASPLNAVFTSVGINCSASVVARA